MVRIATGFPQMPPVPRSYGNNATQGILFLRQASSSRRRGRFWANRPFRRFASNIDGAPVFETLMECGDERLPLRTSMTPSTPITGIACCALAASGHAAAAPPSSVMKCRRLR
jgi:hypothetical protein